MSDTPMTTMDDLIEYQRTKGDRGIEPWLRELPPDIGRLLSALGLLETYAGQIAGPWIEGAMNEEELWEFARISSFDRVSDCAQAIDGCVRALQDVSLASEVDAIWRRLQSHIERLRESESSGGFAWGVAELLFATMIMRQWFLDRVLGRTTMFAFESPFTCRQYTEMAISRAGESPFGCAEGVSIDVLSQAVIDGLKVDDNRLNETRKIQQVVLQLLQQVPRPPEEEIPSGTNQPELLAFEARTGISLPPELQEWLKTTNGPRIGPGGIFGVSSSNSDLDMDVVLGIYPEWKDEGWLPIAGDGCGNYYVLASKPERGGRYPVYFIDTMRDTRALTYVVASGLWQFLWFLLNKEITPSKWPFDEKEVVATDPAIVDVGGDLLPWKLRGRC